MRYRKLCAAVILFLLFVVAGCRKEELARFNSRDAVYFYQGTYDTVNVYFPKADGTYGIQQTRFNSDTTRNLDTMVSIIGAAPATAQEVILEVRVMLQGNTSKSDRKFKLNIDQQTSTIPMDAITMKDEDCVVKAGTSVSYVPVRIKRLAQMAKQPMYITVKLAAVTNDLSVDYAYRTVSKTQKNIITRTYGLYDNVPKPGWWSSIGEYYFGPFSRAKYTFIKNYFGVTDDYIQSNDLSPYILIAWGQRFYCVLKALTDAGKPVMDYNDVTGVAFPMASGGSSKNSCIEDLQ
ncbi:DUF4843 domain-containing protein [Chitinophaga dinghuensis]|nr:DUF4843 domain-containing protein [Chitinophaga dinghuensis]